VGPDYSELATHILQFKQGTCEQLFPEGLMIIRSWFLGQKTLCGERIGIIR
jgi:hypothetical protein